MRNKGGREIANISHQRCFPLWKNPHTSVEPILIMFSYIPIKANWDVRLYLDLKTHCPPRAHDVLTIHGQSNIISNSAQLILPIPMVRKMQTTLKKSGIAADFEIRKLDGEHSCAMVATRDGHVTRLSPGQAASARCRNLCIVQKPIRIFWKVEATPF